MTEPKRKANRWGLILPWMLAIVVCVGWSAYWFYGRGKIETGLTVQAEAMRQAGYTADWSNRRVSGYPFRYFIQLENAHIAEPGGWGARAPKVEAAISALTPNVIVLVAPNGMILERPGKPATAVNGEVLRMSLGGINRPAPWRISVEGVNVDLGAPGDDLPFSEMARFEFHLRPEESNAARLLLRLEEARPAANSMLSRLASGGPLSLGLEGKVTQADKLRGEGWAGMVGGWSAAGGVVEIAQGGLTAGEALVSLRPAAIGADAQGFAAGDLKLTLGRASDGVLALGEIGVLPQETAAVASGVAAAQSAFSSGSGIDISLEFARGQTWLGPIPLGPAPRIFGAAAQTQLAPTAAPTPAP